MTDTTRPCLMTGSNGHSVSEPRLRTTLSGGSRSQEKEAGHTRSSLALGGRPVIMRRHQTMISKEDEFLKSVDSVATQTENITAKTTTTTTTIITATTAPSPSTCDECQILPCASFTSKPDDTTKRISPETVVDVLEGKYREEFDQLFVIDCRFPYEFEGGHIKDAVNINTTDMLDRLLLQPAITDKRVLLIFHCEFSCERGPRMARHLRNQDRSANAANYPALFYPEVYVMKGGYSGFFKLNRSHCLPEAYIEMQDENHAQEFETHMKTFKREFSRTASKGFMGVESKKPRSASASVVDRSRPSHHKPSASLFSPARPTLFKKSHSATTTKSNFSIVVSSVKAAAISGQLSQLKSKAVSSIDTSTVSTINATTTIPDPFSSPPRSSKSSTCTTISTTSKSLSSSLLRKPSAVNLPRPPRPLSLAFSPRSKLSLPSISKPLPNPFAKRLNMTPTSTPTCTTQSTTYTSLSLNSAALAPLPFANFRRTKPVFNSASSTTTSGTTVHVTPTKLSSSDLLRDSRSPAAHARKLKVADLTDFL